MNTAAWSRQEKLAAVLPSGYPVYRPTWSHAGYDLFLTPEARAAGYHEGDA